MDGSLLPHVLVGEVDTEAGPQPYCTTDMAALRAVGEAHAAQMAREAGRIARRCAPRTPFDPAAALLEAEAQQRREAQRRVFQGDKLRGLRDAGRITTPQYRAALEIADLITWIEAGKQVMARSQFSERLAASTSTIALHQVLEEAERLRYGPWRVWAGDFPVNKFGKTMEHLVRAFVVQNLGVRQAGIAFRMDQRRAEALFVRALAQYVLIAGWGESSDSA